MKILLASAAVLAVAAATALPANASPFGRGFGGPHIIRGLPPIYGIGVHHPIYGILVHPPRPRGVWVNGPWGPRGIWVGPWGRVPGPRGVPVERAF